VSCKKNLHDLDNEKNLGKKSNELLMNLKIILDRNVLTILEKKRFESAIFLRKILINMGF